MPATPVRVARVSIDPPAKKVEGRTRYRITLTCGCFWWEDRNATDPAPTTGASVKCYRSHDRRDEQRVADFEVAS